MSRRIPAVVVLTLAAVAAAASPAAAEFPFRPPADHADYKSYRLESSHSKPNDLAGKVDWMYAADKESGNEPVNSDARELFGVRGAHVVDRTTPVGNLAWGTTTGRPDVTIAVLDSGIKWNDVGAMQDLRKKTRLTKGELPVPLSNRATSLEAGETCSTYTSQDDANGDGVFNVVDYSCDSRVERDPALRGNLGVGPANLLDPQDVLIAFSDGVDDDGNGFKDDIVGWDFLDDDNDPFDDVQYGHGTGEARDSSGEADNGGDLGSCPNCTVIHMRVGDSFIADVNRFAQAVVYATDNDVLVVQEALGTLNNSTLGRDAVEYAYDHGVAVIASAADEAAEHHNWPSSLPHTILVNSIEKYDIAITPANRSYLQFNGCTNFSSKITVAIPSVSCSSDATGRGAGMAGLVYSAALNARETGKLGPHATCQRTDGSTCALSVSEVRQIMASGTIDAIPQADDINFANQPEPACAPVPTPTCTDPNFNAPYDKPIASPLATTSRYPTRKGFDQIFGWGRINMNHAVDALMPSGDSLVPPEVELTSPEWYEQIDPGLSTVSLRGEVGARGAYSCEVLVAPGSQPHNGRTTDVPPGDFQQVASSWCDGSSRSGHFEGVLAQLDIQALKARFPVTTGSFNGREPGIGIQSSNGRPNTQPYGFTVKVVARRVAGSAALTGEDRRNMYLHRDQDMANGFPRQLTSDGASSPLFVDLDADNRNELVLATSDGEVHAYRPDGSELPGWPVSGDSLPLHTGGRAFTSGEVAAPPGGPFLASISAADMDRDGSPEVVGADLEGKLYVWSGDGQRIWKQETNVDYSGKPLQPFVDVRFNRSNPDESKRRRTQHGFIGSPVLVDIDGDGGRLEIVAAAMDRHVYAWNHDGTQVPGFPAIVVDGSKVASIDPQTHAVTFNANAGSALNQGAVVDTPAVGDLTGDGRPEIVVGTNEEYAANQGNEGPYNASNFNSASVALIALAGGISFGGFDNPLSGLANVNSRVYAMHPDGEAHSGGPFLSGWPAKVGLLQAELLPVVGEGITGSPAIGPVTCANGGQGPKVGAMGNGGPAYIFNTGGQSCYGRDGGRDIALQTDFATSPQKYDTPAIPAVGHPSFGDLGGTITFLAPAAGLLRALDLAANEYQGGQDFVAAWEPTTGQFRSGFPSPVNDLQFLTGPSIADIDGVPGEESVSGTASLDLTALNAGGAQAGPTWPKLTSDWTVANPTIGSFGTIDTEASARKRIVALTRSGTIFSYNTNAPACSSGSWPRFHHDNANSGDYRRDAVSPGKPYDVSSAGGTVTFKAPGDDLLCGTADHYEVVQSNSVINGQNFEDQEPVSGAPAPQQAGSTQSFGVPADAKRFIGIRAVDDQGNVGPVAVVVVTAGFDRPASASPLTVELVPAFRQTISSSQCAARGGTSSTHGSPLTFESCNPPAYLPGTAARLGPQAQSSVSLTAIEGNAGTTADEADLSFSLNATDVRDRGSGGDYEPNPAGADVTLVQKLRLSDTYNGPQLNEPATVVDFDFSVSASCAPTVGSEGSTCSVGTSADTLMPGAIREGTNMVFEVFRVRLNDSGQNGTPGNSDDRFFAQQGLYIP